jgi:hypothetical protein
MPTPDEEGLLGKRPHFFRFEPSKEFSEEVWVQYHALQDVNPFESGTAYSLHLKRDDAEKFEPRYLHWRNDGDPMVAYVSERTYYEMVDLKKIMQTIFERE